MAAPPTIYLVCSDRDGNGKTLLARILVDFLLAAERDPFCFDLDAPAGKLRTYFPGRTAVVDFTTAAGQEKLLATLLERPGRDYVIDSPAAQLADFCEAANAAGLTGAAHGKGSAIAVLYIVDNDEASLKTALALEQIVNPDLFVPVVNRFVGSALPEGVPGPVLFMDKLHQDLQSIISNRHFSLRAFMMGDEDSVPSRFRATLKAFLQRLISGMNTFESALTHEPDRGQDHGNGI
jgi:hypothetical protein